MILEMDKSNYKLHTQFSENHPFKELDIFQSKTENCFILDVVLFTIDITFADDEQRSENIMGQIRRNFTSTCKTKLLTGQHGTRIVGNTI